MAFDDIVELADPGGAKPFHAIATKWFANEPPKSPGKEKKGSKKRCICMIMIMMKINFYF